MKRTNRFIHAFLAPLMLCVTLFSFQVSYAGPDAVDKKEIPDSEKEAAETDKESKYVYNPAGKIDPFVSFIKKSRFSGKGLTSLSGKEPELGEGELFTKNGVPETELEKIEISKLTLTAVIKGKSKIWAMVIDPKGSGYFLEKGTKIGMHSGVVDQIISEEKKTDFGDEIIRKVIIKIPYHNRNREIIYKSVEMEMPYKTM